MTQIHIFVKSLYRKLLNIWRLNWIATIFLNFAKLPVAKALLFPIHCYGKIKIISLRGKIILPDKIHSGMIKIGYRWWDLWPSSYLPTQINLLGTLEFRGTAIISGGCSINIQSRQAILTIDNQALIGGGSLIKTVDKITLDPWVRITGNCIIQDCDMHYLKNIITGTVTRNRAPIHIGHHCWINAYSVVSKGADIPPYTIIARNSFISKDVTNEGSYCIFAGSPAKVIKRNIYRVFDFNVENQIAKYFRENPSAIALELPSGIDPADE